MISGLVHMHICVLASIREESRKQLQGGCITSSDLSLQGTCNESCDLKCNPSSGATGKHLTWRVCCPGPAPRQPATEFPNMCYAKCIGGVVNPWKTCSYGSCKLSKAVSMLRDSPCPIGAPTAVCFSDPCQAACAPPASIEATCVAMYCPKFYG